MHSLARAKLVRLSVLNYVNSGRSETGVPRGQVCSSGNEGLCCCWDFPVRYSVVRTVIMTSVRRNSEVCLVGHG